MDLQSPDILNQPFPYIYSGSLDQPSLKGFNAIAISLDARLDSNLKWEKAVKLAQAYVDQGYKILWELRFGLFQELHLPLSDTSQYRSLDLALDYFFDSVLKNFNEKTIGVSIYKGTLDFSHNWPWEIDQVLNFRGWISEYFEDHHAFTNLIGLPCQNLLTVDPKDLYALENGKNLLRFYCMRAALDYFSMLSSRFETSLLPYLLLDCSTLHSPAHVFQLLDHQDLEFIQLVVKNLPFEAGHAMGWESKAFANGYIGKEFKEYQAPHIEPRVGIVIPTKFLINHKDILKYDDVICEMEEFHSVKLISERNITIDWQGLDELVVLDVEPDSKRKLEGFIAAGGKVITEKKLFLSEEMSYQNYLKSKENS